MTIAFLTAVIAFGADEAAVDQKVANYRRALHRIERLASISLPSEKDRRDFQAAVAAGFADFPTEPEMGYWKADAFERERKTGDAIAQWRKVVDWKTTLPGIDDRPARSRCLQRLAYARLADFDTAGAEELVGKALELAPADPKGYQCLLDVSFRTGKLDPAVRRVEAAAAKYGEQAPAVRVLYHDLLARMGDWSTLRSTLEAQPENQRRPEDDEHFRARLAEVAGDRPGAFIHHFLCYFGGPADQPTCQRSREYLDKLRGVEPENLPAAIRPLALAVQQLDHDDTAPKALETLRSATASDSPAERLVLGYLKARALTAAGDRSDLEAWRKLAAEFPKFPPAICGLAEAVETSDPTSPEVYRLFTKARTMQPMNWKVREIFRLGARWQFTKDGVVATDVETDSPWDRFGLKKGDEVLALDDQGLRQFATGPRMLKARLFQGGRVTYRNAKGETATREMELVLFSF